MKSDQIWPAQKTLIVTCVYFRCLPGLKAAGVSRKLIYDGTHVIVSFTCSPSCM